MRIQPENLSVWIGEGTSYPNIPVSRIFHDLSAFALLFLIIMTACSRQPVYPSPSVSGPDAVINVSALKPDMPNFFTYRSRGKNISFFVIKTDEKVSAFLDACASCYPHKLGYRYEDGSVTCRFCNMKFSLYKLEKGLGGCYPIKIEGGVDKNNYRIPLSVLENAAEKF